MVCTETCKRSFAEFYDSSQGNFEDNLFVEGMSMVQFTARTGEVPGACPPTPGHRDGTQQAHDQNQKAQQVLLSEVDKGDDVRWSGCVGKM
jgi:hypothetical protein